jgi:hypothetical protein
MRSLSEYLFFTQIINTCNESISNNVLRRLKPHDIREGMLSMYEYISHNDNIKMFYMDFNSNERALWEELYKLYTKGLWNIAESNYNASSLNIEEGKLKLANSEIKRKLRFANNDIDVSQIEYALIIDDDLKNHSYIVFINRLTNLLDKFTQKTNYDLLINVFKNLSKN